MRKSTDIITAGINRFHPRPDRTYPNMSFQLVVSANIFWAAEWDPMVGIGETLLVQPGRLILNSLLTWG